MFLGFVEETSWKEIRQELDTMNVIEDHTAVHKILTDDPGAIRDLTNCAIVFNLGSAINTGYMLSELIANRDATKIPVFNYDINQTPPWNQYTIPMPEMTEESITRGFDLAYAKSIETHRESFVQLFSIMYALYNGADCYVLVGSDSAYKQTITESLMKYIQQRYEISPIGYIACLEDFNSYDRQANFSLTGVYNIDSDIERYVMAAVDFSKLNTDE